MLKADFRPVLNEALAEANPGGVSYAFWNNGFCFVMLVGAVFWDVIRSIYLFSAIFATYSGG